MPDCAPTRKANGFTHDHLSSRNKPESLVEKLQRVSDAWDDFKESRRRDAIYWYLRAVYDLVMEYRRKGRPKRLSRRAYRYIGLPFDKSADVFAAVIRGTSGGELDNKTISKWSRALRFVAERKKPHVPLKTFVKRMGGVNACANEYAKLFGRGYPRSTPKWHWQDCFHTAAPLVNRIGLTFGTRPSVRSNAQIMTATTER
jgi:hypothetical protein